MFGLFLKKIVQPLYFLSIATLLLAFAFHFGEVRGTVAFSSDVEKSKGNKFTAGVWGTPIKDKSNILISEVYYDTSASGEDDEFIELYNPTSTDIDLFSDNYKLGDEETKGAGEGMYKFPNPAVIKSKSYLIIAKNASSFISANNKSPDFEFASSDTSVPDMVKYASWATASVELANTGDEVLLLDKDDKAIDVVTYGSGSYNGITSHISASGAGNSLQRIPKNSDTNNCAVDFVAATPTPGS
jgi:hypothetical protein